MTPGTVLGHEAVGTVEAVGTRRHHRRPGDRVLVSCISACGRCRFCKEGRYGQCLGGGGWILGHIIDGLQAEYVRTPFADNSLYKVPTALSDEQVLMLADILPTAYEVGVLNGGVSPGDAVAIVGAGPIGLAAITDRPAVHARARSSRSTSPTAGLTRPSEFGADVTINNGREDASPRSMELTGRPRCRCRASRRSASRRRSSLPPSSSGPAGTSRTSVCTASRRRCTWRRSGSATSPSRPGSSTPLRSRS